MVKIISYPITTTEIIQTIESHDKNNKNFQLKIIRKPKKTKLIFTNTIKKALIVIEDNIVQIIQANSLNAINNYLKTIK